MKNPLCVEDKPPHMCSRCGCVCGPLAIYPEYVGQDTVAPGVRGRTAPATRGIALRDLPVLRGRLVNARIQVPVTVGFVWSNVGSDPTLEHNTGASVPMQVVGDAVTGLAEFAWQTTLMLDGTYSVRTYVVWPTGGAGAPVTYSRLGSQFTVADPDSVPPTVSILTIDDGAIPVVVTGLIDLNGLPLEVVSSAGFVWGTQDVDLTLNTCISSTEAAPLSTTYTGSIDGLEAGYYNVRPFIRYTLPGQFETLEYGEFTDGFQYGQFPTVDMVSVDGDGTTSVAFGGTLDYRDVAPEDVIQVGFVWGTTNDVVLDTGINHYASGEPSASYSGPLAPAIGLVEGDTYYVRAVVWYTVAGEQAIEYSFVAFSFVYGEPPPPPAALVVYTRQAYQTYTTESDTGYLFHMQLEIEMSENVPEDTTFFFLVSATNPDPQIGGADVGTVAATRQVDMTYLASADYFSFDASAVVYVRAVGQLDGENPVLATDVLTVNRVPVIILAKESEVGTVVTFQGFAAYNVYPLDSVPRVLVSRFGYVWTNSVGDPVPSLTNYVVDNVTVAPQDQPYGYVPAFPQYPADYNLGPGTYNCRAYAICVSHDANIVEYSDSVETVLVDIMEA
jgi:hypothetical protein